jgi:hypothetical protein
METTNKWLKGNSILIESVVKGCQEYDARGSYGGALPLKIIIKLLRESSHEIFRLQKQVENLETVIKNQQK